MAYPVEQRDADLLGSKANITYTVHFDRAPQHLVRVVMRVDNVVGDSIELVMPSWSPGSYKVRDYAGYLGNIAAHSIGAGGKSETSTRWANKSNLVVTTNGATSVEVEYLVYCHERTVRTNHVNRFHAYLIPTGTMMYVAGRLNEVHHVLLKHDQKIWPSVSTQLSPVEKPSSKGVLLGALNYDLLADSPMEIGDHLVESFEVEGAQHELAIASNQTYDVDWIVEQLKTIVTTEAKIFGGVPYDRYVFILQVYPNTYGGLEHLRSSVNMFTPDAFLDKKKAKAVLALLCHEFFHLWNVKRIRPIEYGPFDYTTEVYSSMLWLAEGLTSYYDDLLTYRCGFKTEKEYLETLSEEHLTRLMNVPGRAAMSVRDSSYLAWVRLYMQNPDGTNRFPSYYLKGGVIFLLLDLYIIDHTDGDKSLDEVLRVLWKRYKDNPDEGLTEEACIALMERATGVQLRERFMEWLGGTDELPYEAVFEKAGLNYIIEDSVQEPITFGNERSFATVPNEVSMGWTTRESNDRILVSGVLDGGAAQIAGIGIDDEIVAIDSKRVTTVHLLNQLLRDNGTTPVRVTCECDGRLYQTVVTPEAKREVKLSKVDSPSDRQSKIFAKWMNR